VKRRELLTAGVAALAAPWVHAQSSTWPSRPIRLMVQYPPGGLVDTVARLMAPHLSQALGQSVVVDNRAGAGGLIGTDMASKQAPDGYTLLVSHASVHIYATATRSSMPFDPVNDFTHLGMLVEAPMVLLVRAQSPYQNLAQYLTAAKTKPVRYGSSGIGSANHLYGELLKLEGPAPEHDHVPYQGSAPAMQDLLGLSAPKNLPAPIVQRLTTLMPEIMAKPDIMSRLEELQTLPRKTPVVGDEFVKLIRSQITTWTAVAKKAKVEVIV
jgi:tripartite-type tricarboxylate transporter receptor subunit TctC